MIKLLPQGSFEGDWISIKKHRVHNLLVFFIEALQKEFIQKDLSAFFETAKNSELDFVEVGDELLMHVVPVLDQGGERGHLDEATGLMGFCANRAHRSLAHQCVGLAGLADAHCAHGEGLRTKYFWIVDLTLLHIFKRQVHDISEDVACFVGTRVGDDLLFLRLEISSHSLTYNNYESDQFELD